MSLHEHSDDLPALRLAGVEAGYGRRAVLRDVSLTIAPGTRVGLIGPNGSGKSTLFRVALGMLAPWRGEVELFGVSVRQLDRRQQPVAYVPQARQLDRSFPLTAREVVAQGRVGRLGLFSRPQTSDKAAIARALEQADLVALAERPFGALSGGQQQRTLLARALANDAEILFLDEPVTGVDTATQVQLARVIDGLLAEGRTVVVSTHDLAAENLARFDWLVCLNGTIVAQGPPAAVADLAIWRRLFSGRPEEALGL